VLLLAVVYGKHEMDDLTPKQKKDLAVLAAELKKELLHLFSSFRKGAKSG